MNYEETRRWNNFVITDLPPEFTHYLNANLENAINAMTSISPENSTKVNSDDSKISKQRCIEHNQQTPEQDSDKATISIFRHQPSPKIKGKTTPLEKPPIAAHQLYTKELPLSWKIDGKPLSETQKIVRLWNNKMPYLHDVALLDERNLVKLIGDDSTRERFKEIAFDGHRAVAKGAQGYIKTKSEGYKLKILGILGNKRLYLDKRDVLAIDSVNNRYNVFEPIRFVDKAHK